MVQENLRKYSSLKAIQILEAVSTSQTGMTYKSIIEETTLASSSVHRIVNELLETEYLQKDNDGRILIGSKSKVMAIRIDASDYLIDLSKEEMIRLNELTGETIHIINQDYYSGVYIGKLTAKNTVGVNSRIGKKTPLYCTSGGKIILAHQSKNWLETYLSSVELLEVSKNTITDREKLIAELEQIKYLGFSLDNAEYNPDITCVAAPIYGNDNKLAFTISVAAPTYRFSLDDARALSKEVMLSANNIGKKLRTYS